MDFKSIHCCDGVGESTNELRRKFIILSGEEANEVIRQNEMAEVGRRRVTWMDDAFGFFNLIKLREVLLPTKTPSSAIM